MEIHVRKLVSQIKVVNHHLNLTYVTRINRKNINLFLSHFAHYSGKLAPIN